MILVFVCLGDHLCLVFLQIQDINDTGVSFMSVKHTNGSIIYDTPICTNTRHK